MPTLKDALKIYKASPDKAHDDQHIKRVFATARLIAKGHPEVNKQDLRYAAILHDIGRHIDDENHEAIGAVEAVKYLGKIPKDRHEAILEAVREHRHSNGNPQGILAKIIADADRLDSSTARATEYYISKGYSREAAKVEAKKYITAKWDKLRASGYKPHTLIGQKIYNSRR